jgi:hypothetical protein
MRMFHAQHRSYRPRNIADSWVLIFLIATDLCIRPPLRSKLGIDTSRCGGRTLGAGQLLFQCFSSNQVFVFHSFLPILFGVALVLDHAYHAQYIVVKSKHEGSDRVESTRRFGLALDRFHLHDVIHIRTPVGRDDHGARADPLSIHQGFTSSTFTFSAPVLDELSRLNSHFSQWLAWQRHGSTCFVALVEDDRNIPYQTNILKIFHRPKLICQRLLLFPFGFVMQRSHRRAPRTQIRQSA